MTASKQIIAIIVADTPMHEPGSTNFAKFGDFGNQSVKLLTENFIKKSTSIVKSNNSETEISTSSDPPASATGTNVVYKKYLTKLKGEVPSDKEISNLKGVLVTGSREDSFNNESEWLAKLEAFLEKILFQETQVPVVGICFGHQVVGKILNKKAGISRELKNENTKSVEAKSAGNVPVGEVNHEATSSSEYLVGRNRKGWEFGLTEISINHKFQSYVSKLLLFPSDDEKLSTVNIGKSFSTNNLKTLYLVEHHQDVVYDVPPHVSLIGSSPLCKVQGFFNQKNILTFQGHPEFSTEFLDEICLRRKVAQGILSEKGYNEIVSQDTSLRINDGNVIGKLINGFFNNYQ